jgi:hypothetical protein
LHAALSRLGKLCPCNAGKRAYSRNGAPKTLKEALGLARGAERARPGAAAAEGPAVAGNTDVEPVRNG